jgi:hypothetical protein
MKISGMNCPFCGVVADVPHENQEGCIDALHAEIARMRALIEQSRPADDLPVPPRPADEREPV